MGQALKFCTRCENKRGCDICADLHEWIMEHLETEKVVKCKDCVGRPFWEKDHNGVPVCVLSGLYVRSENDFCSYGERKDGGVESEN